MAFKQSSKDILHVCRSYPHHRLGGMENHAQDLIDECIERGYVVHVITTPLPSEPAVRALETNGEILEIGNSSARYDLAFYRELGSAISKLVKRYPIQVIHFQGFGGVIWEIIRKLGLSKVPKNIKSIHSIHGTLTSETPLFARHFRRLTISERLKAIWQYKHRVAWAPLWWIFVQLKPNLIVDSNFTARLLRKINKRLSPFVMPLGFWTDELSMQSDRMVLNRDEDIQTPYALYIGRLEKTKNPTFLVEIWENDTDRQLPRLVIAGDGPEKAIIEKLIGKHSLESRIEVLGKVSNEKRLQLLQNASIFLNPDLGYPAFGLANLEALCFGVPVLATPNGAHREVLQGNGGILMKPDARDWEKAITSKIESYTDGMKESRKKKTRVRFSRSVMGEKYDKYINMTGS